MQFPLMNDIRFVPEGYSVPNKYRQQQFDRDWAHNMILEFQRNLVYFQPKQHDDDNCVQIGTNCSDLELQIWDTKGNILDTLYPDASIVLAGDEYHGQGMTRYQWQFKLQDVIPSFTGICYYVIKGTTPMFLNDVYAVSEPIKVKAKWEDTVLINYNHNRNEYGVAFSLNPIFSIRVNGYLLYDDTTSSDTELEDQYNSNKTLHSATIRKFKLTIGGYTGIPKYLHNKLVEAFRCREIKVDGWFYSKDKGAQLEYEKSDTNTLFTCSIMLQEAYPADAYTFSGEQMIQLLPATGFPYAVLSLALMDNQTSVFTFIVDQSNPIIIEDLTDAGNKVSAWNAAASGWGLLGSFDIQDGCIVYINDLTEDFIPVSDAKYKFFSMAYYLNSTNAQCVLKFINYYPVLVDWGSTLQVVNTSFTLQSVGHNFGNGGSPVGANIRIFHNDDIYTFISEDGFVTNAKVASIGNVMSSNLQVYEVTNVDSTITNFDLEFLKYCCASLTSLTMTGTTIETLTNAPFSYNAANYATNFHLLAQIDLSDNEITVAAIEDFVVSLRDYANYAYQATILGKTISMDNQTPSAPPNSNTTAAIGDLVSAGWVGVNFD